MALTLVKGSTWDSHENLLIDTVGDLTSVLEQKDIIITRGHTTVSDNGGGSFVYNSSLDRSNHDNGTIIDATGSGVGLGCWVREYTLSNFSLCFFGSNDTNTTNLLSQYGIHGASVFISSVDGGMFVFDGAEINNHDGKNNFNGWIRKTTSSLIRDLEAITGITKLGDGEYTGEKAYTLYNQYLYGSDQFSVYVLKQGVSVPYTVDLVAYPTIEEDPNLLEWQFGEDHQIHEETLVLNDGQLDVNYVNYPVEKATFYLSGAGADQGRILEGVDYTKNVGANSITLTESQPGGTECTLVIRDIQGSAALP